MDSNGSFFRASEGFVRPKFNVTKPTPPEEGNLFTLPDLVEFNATYNRDHLFCAQYGHNIHLPPTYITHGDLFDAVLRFSAWLVARGLAQRPKLVDGRIVKARPVAMLMSSDVMWFITFVSLIRLGVPVLCMSARLSPQAVVHLVRKTDAQALLVSPQLDSLIDESKALFASAESEETSPSWHQVPSYVDFLGPATTIDSQIVPPPPPYISHDDRNVVILHSSGTTGLPKPIFHSHAYLLGYAACHRLTPSDVLNAMNVSTLPLFHGFGLLAPSLSLSIGLPFSLPASTTIPTGTSTHEVLLSSHATSLLTVPSILEELYLLPNGTGIAALKNLNFVAVGGAPMKQTVASAVAGAGVNLLNHWGVTEIGAIAPIMHIPKDYDWRYLRVRDDIHLRFEPLPEHPGHVRLVGRPPLTDEDFVVQDLLVANPENPTREFRIAGRADDLVVLANGEKVRPSLLEQAVSEHPLVRGALAFGEGKFQLGLIVEAASHVALDFSDAAAVEAFVDQVWEAVERGNEKTDLHARVAREMILVTHADVKPLIRTPKGSIPRGPNVQQFKEQVDALYLRADALQADPLPLDNPTELKSAVRKLVLDAARRIFGDTDDFFERGMDSLQATTVRRRVAAGLAASAAEAGREARAVPMDIVYANPSIEMLCAAVEALWTDGEEVKDRLEVVKEVREEYVRKVLALRPAPIREKTEGKIVLLTGSSGSLGSAMLYELASSKEVERVYALNRKGGKSLRERQEEGIRKLGVEFGEELWGKVRLVEAELGEEQFGLGEEVYEELKGVTHIIHNAWPMDFNRTLTSFRPHLDATLHILFLALSAPTRVHVLFSSSIAVVGRSPLLPSAPSFPSPILESYLDDPAAIDHFGYAEAKWVCEEMFRAASEKFTEKIVAGVVRIGQMTGPERTGAWNVAEHFPMIVKTCQALGILPEISGTASWIPVDRAARVMTELLFASSDSRVLHLENPTRQPWPSILTTLASSLSIDKTLPYERWLEKIKESRDAERNPCVKIVPFLESEFVRMAAGAVVLDTSAARERSRTLRESGEVSEEVVGRYVEFWKQEGFFR